MMYKAKVIIGALALLTVSCTGKSGANAVQREAAFSANDGTDAPQRVAGFPENEKSDLTRTANVDPNARFKADSDTVELKLFYTTDADRAIFQAYKSYIEPFRFYPISTSDLIIETAQFFLNKPYVASTLEIEPEGLVVNLREFDCTTFVETVLALSRVVRMHDNPTFDDFCRTLQNIRYRRGFIGNYTDRNHYFSDWIYENETRGYVKDVTQDIGGEPYRLNLHFMSSHPESYKPLQSHPEYVEIMRKKEKEISGRDVYMVVPKTKLSTSEEKMQNGDIVCFVTNIDGLDVSHVGIIYRDKGSVSFIHASTGAKKIMVETQGLSAYVGKNRRNTGVMIVRPQFSE